VPSLIVHQTKGFDPIFEMPEQTLLSPDCSPPDLRVATREFSRDPRKNAAGASDAAADNAAGASDAAADNFLAAVA